MAGGPSNSSNCNCKTQQTRSEFRYLVYNFMVKIFLHVPNQIIEIHCSSIIIYQAFLVKVFVYYLVCISSFLPWALIIISITILNKYSPLYETNAINPHFFKKSIGISVDLKSPMYMPFS